MIKARLLFSCTLLFLVSSLFGQEKSDPGLSSDNWRIVVEDLSDFIPKIMAEKKVLGLSIAYIENNTIVWKKGFGFANSISRGRVNEETIFSVASNGKTVSAYAAMQLMQEGKLELEKPLQEYLQNKWLPDSIRHNSINLKQVLTHSTGLSNFLRDEKKNLSFDPGAKFSYSGVGFMYMQEVMEAIAGKSLDDIISQNTFQPLGMRSSYFSSVNKPAGRSEAAGHISLLRALAPFSIIFIPSFLFLGLLVLISYRVFYGNWKLPKQIILIIASITGIGALYFLFYKSGSIIMAAYFTLVFLGFIMIGWGLTLILDKLSNRILTTNKSMPIKPILFGIIIILLFSLNQNAPVPAPDWFPKKGNAASSLRSTASDLAKFMIELGKGEHLNDELLVEMTKPQIKVHDYVSWGLGVGIKRGNEGKSLWHWGSNPGSKSLMVYYPEKGSGIVVLTNNENGSEITYDIAKRALGGNGNWSISN